MRRAAFSLALLLAATAAGAVSAQTPGGDSLGAGWSPQQKTAREKVRDGAHVPLGKVVQTVKARIPGRLLDAGIEDGGGRDVYRVRWAAADGRRVDVIVDAATGAVIREEGR